VEEKAKFYWERYVDRWWSFCHF